MQLQVELGAPKGQLRSSHACSSRWSTLRATYMWKSWLSSQATPSGVRSSKVFAHAGHGAPGIRCRVCVRRGQATLPANKRGFVVTRAGYDLETFEISTVFDQKSTNAPPSAAPMLEICVSASEWLTLCAGCVCRERGWGNRSWHCELRKANCRTVIRLPLDGGFRVQVVRANRGCAARQPQADFGFCGQLAGRPRQGNGTKQMRSGGNSA